MLLEIKYDGQIILTRIKDARFKHDTEALYALLLDGGVENWNRIGMKPRKGYYWNRYVQDNKHPKVELSETGAVVVEIAGKSIFGLLYMLGGAGY